MKIHKSEVGFSPLHVLLLLVLLGIIGFTGWKVYDTSKKVNVPQPSTYIKNETTAPSEFVEYNNAELGLKFTYPREWGSVIKDRDSSSELFYGRFAKNSHIVFTVAPKDYTPLVIDTKFPGPGCGQLGFGSFSFLSTNNNFPEYYYFKELLRSSERQVLEKYQTGYCAVRELAGRVKLTTSYTNGIDMAYSEQIYPGISNDTAGPTHVQEYMKDKTRLFSDALKKQFIDLVNSVQTTQ